MEQQGIQAEWISYREAQRLTGLGRTSLWQLVSAGKIPVAGYGRARRLNRRVLEEYMWSQVTDAQEQISEDHR